jgi:hypothetical protein
MITRSKRMSKVKEVKEVKEKVKEEVKEEEITKKDSIYSMFILNAIDNLKEFKKGSSRSSIKREIEDSQKIELINSALRIALKTLVENNSLIQHGQRFRRNPQYNIG